MSDLERYIKNNYGTCDRESDCYHGENGCLSHGWLGIRCPHWHPVSDEEMEKMKRYFQ